MDAPALAAATALLTAPWLVDQAVRMRLAAAARRWRAADGAPPRSWLVLVPARAEGEAVRDTLASVVLAARGAPAEVRTVLLLDGGDPEAAAAARGSGATVVVKEPAGPSKAAALAWVVRERPELLEGTEAVLVLDVGSRLLPGFFAAAWPGRADAVQAHLAGAGTGAGEAAALSETAAQRWQDRGREVLGWSVRLRGTGTAYRPAVFRELAPRLRTVVEDTEASLLLAAAGRHARLAPETARVEDVKPARAAAAARQRSRWLLGQVQLVTGRAAELLRLVRRSPAEGLALAAELLSRPLSLTAAARAGLGAAWTVAAAAGAVPSWGWGAAVVLMGSAAAELAAARRLTGRGAGELVALAARMTVAWLGALARLPLALGRWSRAR